MPRAALLAHDQFASVPLREAQNTRVAGMMAPWDAKRGLHRARAIVALVPDDFVG